MDRTILEALRTAGLLDISDEQFETLATLDVASLDDAELGNLGDLVRGALDTVIDPIESNEAEATDEVIAVAAGLRDGFVALAAAAHGRMSAEADRRARVASIVASLSPEEPVEDAERPPASTRPPLERVAARRRRQEVGRPARPNSAGRLRIKSGRGGDLAGVEAIADELIDVSRDLRFSWQSAPSRRVATIAQVDVPEERRLSAQDGLGNGRKIEAVVAAARRSSPEELHALTASGGICAPPMPLYSQLGISDSRRPIRDSLPPFTADRGAIIHMPPPRFHRALSSAERSEDSNAHDFSKGVGVWTAANDVALNNPATKPITKVDCEETVTDTVNAITKRLEIGNFYNMTYRERVLAILDMLDAEHAALAEETLLTKIVAGSTIDTTGQELGVARDLLVAVERAATAYRARHRMQPDATLSFMAPEWLINAMRADLGRMPPGDDELNTQDAEIVDMFRTRHLEPTWYADRVPNEFGPQAVGALDAWPQVCEFGLWAPGSWIYLDGGTIDLGVIRDSVLADTNDLQMFMESFEGLAFVGHESMWIQSSICVNGQTSAPKDASGLCLGS